MMRLCFLLLSWLLLANAHAEELITSFHSDIMIHPSGQITVTESIEVNAERREINRGIYRDFPTQYFGAWLTQKQVGFDVKSVTRNGEAEPFHTEKLTNGIRIYMGSSSAYLDPGLHQYQLVYTTDQQLGYFDNYDEFYWNVTGTGWAFPIQEASVSVTLPGGGLNLVLDQSAWTGYQGEQDQNFVVANTADTLGFKTSQRLEPYQGLTVGIQFAKGLLNPKPFDWLGFIKNNVLWLLALVTALFYVGFYLSAWFRYGIDPDPGVIMARFKPPKGLSPAAVHYIDNGHANDQTFVAALVSMAVKGCLKITQLKKQYRIKLIKERPKTPLSSGEKSVKQQLFSDRSRHITISKQYNSSVRYAKNALNSKLKKEYQNRCFKDNGFYVLCGWLISVVCFFIGTLLIYQQHLNLGELLAILIGFVVIISIALAFLAAAPIFMGILLLFILASHYMDIFYWLLEHQKWLYFVLFLLTINGLFTYLLRAPTPFGRHLKDQIDGLKLYMKAAEEQRLDLMNPPDKTLEHYEELLPYAVALNLENQWAKKFTNTLHSQAEQNSGHGSTFQPKWLHSEYTPHSDFNTSISNLTRSMKSHVARSTTIPSAPRSASSRSYSSSRSGSSSSYSSGSSSSGGSSGGGGGGGGGGGW